MNFEYPTWCTKFSSLISCLFHRPKISLLVGWHCALDMAKGNQRILQFCKVRQFSPFEQICIRIWDVLKLSKNLILAFKAVGRNQIFFSNSVRIRVRMHFFHCFYLSHRIQQPITNSKFSPFFFQSLLFDLDKAIFGITLSVNVNDQEQIS